MYVRMLIAVASHAMDHESSANRRKNLEIYEKATSGEYAHTRPLACGRVCVRVRSCPHRDHSSGLRRASERVVGTGRKRPEDRVQVYKGSWKGGDLPQSPFIRTAAFSDSLPAIPLVYSLSSFAASQISRLLFSLSLAFSSRLSL